ncbi:autotransporter outer membrane beta-barrel domain-containing protein [Pseudomonas syringae]|nr:autotransporter outer membrane beta-barrel domain-containing protein [Pseudomonas syringae]
MRHEKYCSAVSYGFRLLVVKRVFLVFSALGFDVCAAAVEGARTEVPLIKRLAYEEVIGTEKTVDASTPLASWEVRENGVLRIIEGGRAAHVNLKQSRLEMRGGHITESLQLADSLADIENASIRNETGAGIKLWTYAGVLKPGSKAVVRNSTVEGVEEGIAVGAYSQLTLHATNVYASMLAPGTGVGIRVSGASVMVADGSHITGKQNGLLVQQGKGEAFGELDGSTNTIVVDASTLQGLQGPAIRLASGIFDGRVKATVTLQNGSTLLSGNGNLVEAAKDAYVDLIVDNTQLTGHLVAYDTSTLNVTLQNQARLTGNIVNGNALSIHSGGYWQMVDDNAIKSLTLDRGAVSFGDGGFKTLTLDHLAGSGTFSMRIDLDQGDGDLLDVQGQAYGQFGLRVRNTGTEVVSPGMEPLLLVHTEGGNAQFNLLGGRVDLGTYSYQLEQQGNDWFIVGDKRTISPSTASALALFNAGPTIWMSELSTLRSRMGEVRTTGLGGGWMRGYGNRFEATTGDGIDYRQKQQGFSLGADTPVPVSNGQLSLGVMVGHSQSDLDLSAGTRGEVGSVYVGTYATWLSDQGYYLDAVLKLNRLRNKAKVAMSDSTKAKGDYDNTGFGGSVELGRHIKLADDWFVEPYAQLAAVTLKGERYRMDNGLQASNSQTRSILGKVGTSVGRDIALKDGGVLQPYLRVALAQEFSRHNSVRVNDSRFDNDLSGTRAEVGAGVSVSLSERLQLHADFDYMNGKQVKQPWGANVGLRLAF